MISAQIGERRYVLPESTAAALIGLLDEQKRFWEWEEQIAEQRRLIEAMKETRDAAPKANELRDWFAGLALIGVSTYEDAARYAYRVADAMLKERSKE